MTKKALQAELKKLGIAFRSRDTKDTLKALLEKATTVAKKSPPAPATARTTKGSVKQVLRTLFDTEGKSIPVDDVMKKLSHVKPETVTTLIADLRNEKYCGPEGTIDIRKDGEKFVRVH